MRTLLPMVAVLFFLFATPSAYGQPRSAIDQELTEEAFRALGQNIASALDAAAATSRAVGIANTEVAQARRAYWAEYDRGIRNGPAAAAFGRRLLGKDTILMTLSVLEGTQGTTFLGFTALFGKLDGGVPELARVPFEDWITAIRWSMGALRPGAQLTPTPAEWQTAIERTAQWYEVYRQWRNYAEFRVHGLNPPRPTIEAPDPAAMTALRPDDRGWRLTGQDPFLLAGPGNPLIRCTYTSTSRDARVMQFFFWRDKVSLTRAQVQAAVAANPQSGLAILLSSSVSPPDVAVSACPPEWDKANEMSRVFQDRGLDGNWLLRRAGGDATLERLFGGASPAERITIRQVGMRLTVLGPSWNGTGDFDGRTGFYNSVLPGGAQARTEIMLDENGVLHGKVRGTNVFEWDFTGTREQ